MRNLDARLRSAESQIAEHQNQFGPRAAIRVALDVAAMDLCIPALDPDDPAERQELIDRVRRLEHALETGDLHELADGDLEITTPAEAGITF